MVGAFSSAEVAGEVGALLGGLALCRSLGSGLDLCGLQCRFGLYCGLVLGFSLCFGSAVFVVVFLAVVVERLRVVVLAAGFALDSCLGLWLGGRLLDFDGGFAAAFRGCLRGGLRRSSLGRLRLRSRGLLAAVVLDAVVFFWQRSLPEPLPQA